MGKNTIKLTESEFREMVMHKVRGLLGEEPVFPSDRFSRRPSMESTILESAVLGEGLVRTYPFEWVGRYLQRNANSDFKAIMSNDIEKKFQVIIKQNSKSIAPLKHTMETFGYYCGYEYDDTDNGLTTMQFEPKFDEYVKGSEFAAPKGKLVFIHVAPQMYKDRILRQGLVPRHRNNMFKYPDRVYLMLASSGLGASYDMARMLYMADGNKHNDGTYSMFGVTVDGLEDTKFYRDWNIDHAEAYYTHENIPPANIKYLKTFKAD